MDQLKRINIALSDIIEETFDIAHLKDARTGKYIQSSPGFAEKLGLESARDVIGLTVNDLITHPKTWGGKNFSPGFVQWRGQQPEIFKNFDQKVQSTKCRARQETLLFSPEGNILVQDTIKTPIFDHNHKTVIAIYTHSRDFTFQRSLPELLSLYTEFYPQEQAIQHLLMHLEIDGYFNALPTPEEMNILFSIHQTPHMDEATVHSPHFLSLQEKVEKNDWQEMLIRLCAVPAIECG
ncbi:Putative transcriptional regulator [Candidatus Glomeribacter gigasporarum BEG34]|uniref:Putative transcriptional regulator n=1 Tax=Candidatus Glomeribacter gigasporarum BEG34 TaxID=1070319 RepID=G2J891_9BURK|nr:hypothetical protein [Candidatus Glomeribacter gigasporarum]CCD28988.1 Putative transcriptional regulator [Candidatus Glomeribacter gigasporarum BEG34]